MTNEEIDKIIKSFSNTLLETNTFARFLCAKWYPESLLAYPKEHIRKAIERAIVSGKLLGNKETVELLEASLGYLESFIDDEEAYRRNYRIMGQKAYWEGLRRQN